MARTKTVTLTANTPQTVTLDSWEAVEVTNLNGLAEVWVRLDGVNPAVDADNAVALPAAISSVVLEDKDLTATVAVRLLSTGAARVHVRAVSKQGLA